MHPPHVLLHIMCDYLRINYNSTVNLQQQHKGRQPSTNLRQGGKGVIGPIKLKFAVPGDKLVICTLHNPPKIV